MAEARHAGAGALVASRLIHLGGHFLKDQLGRRDAGDFLKFAGELLAWPMHVST